MDFLDLNKMEYLGKFIGGGSGGSGGHGGGGGFGFNPLAQFDRTGDGKITEEGTDSLTCI